MLEESSHSNFSSMGLTKAKRIERETKKFGFLLGKPQQLGNDTSECLTRAKE